MRNGPLVGIKVVDMAGPLGGYCGKLFADLGADVTLIEPLAGAPTRGTRPLLQEGQTGTPRSLRFEYENTNKRAISIDLASPQGRHLLSQLVRHCDLFIESEIPGTCRRMGLDYETLSPAHPALVMTSITAFGQEGPCAGWAATDLTAMGMGGMLYLAGYTDSAPIVACGEQAIGAANAFAAVASLAAVLYARETARGQHVDVSMQECVALGLENSVQFYELEGIVRKRNGGTQWLAGTGVFRCRDGYIYMIAGGVGNVALWDRTVDWLNAIQLDGAQQLCGDLWHEDAYLRTEQAKQIFLDVFGPFVGTRSRDELEEIGVARSIPIAAIRSVDEVTQDEQRAYRHFFVDVTDQGAGVLRQPGAPYHFSESPWSIRRPAPTLGQDTAQILNEIGVGSAAAKQLFDNGIVR